LFYFTGTTDFSDRFEPNGSFHKATKVKLPFDTWSEKRFTEISPSTGDVDYFEFEAKAGDVVSAEILASRLDTWIQLFQVVGHGKSKTGILLAEDDDGGVGLLSKLVVTVPDDGRYALAVRRTSFFGAAPQGRYVLSLTK
jgi:hypothetical protein